MDDVSIRVEGIEEARRVMTQLPDAAQRRVMRPSLRRAGRIIVNAIKARATSRRVRKAATTREARGERISLTGLLIGFRRGPGRLAHLLEKGSKVRSTSAGANRGAMPAKPFFFEAIRAAGSAAAAVLRSELATRLAVEARRFASGQLDSKGRIRR